ARTESPRRCRSRRADRPRRDRVGHRPAACRRSMLRLSRGRGTEARASIAVAPFDPSLVEALRLTHGDVGRALQHTDERFLVADTQEHRVDKIVERGAQYRLRSLRVPWRPGVIYAA